MLKQASQRLCDTEKFQAAGDGTERIAAADRAFYRVAAGSLRSPAALFSGPAAELCVRQQQAIISKPSATDRVTETSENGKLLALANSSGFLLQLRIESLVRSTTGEHGWEVVSREHPWRHGAETTGYIDLVLGSEMMRLVVECKRAQEGNWLFLRPDYESSAARRVVAYWARRQADGFHHGGYFDFLIKSSTSVAEFCVIRGSSDDRTALLDRLGSQLVLCCEALGFQDPMQCEELRFERTRVYVPVIVTNSPLQIARFDVQNIDLDSGRLSDADIETVPYLIYNKSLSFAPSGPHNDLRDVSRLTIRSVVVVNAGALTAFLREFEVVYDATRGFWPWSQPR